MFSSMDSTLNHSILCTRRNPTLSNIDRPKHSPSASGAAIAALAVAALAVATVAVAVAAEATIATAEAVTVAGVAAVAAGSVSGAALLDTDGVGGIVGDATSVGVLLMLVAEVILVGTVVPGTEGVGPTAIAVVALVDVGTSGVVAGSVAERVTSEANLVALAA